MDDIALPQQPAESLLWKKEAELDRWQEWCQQHQYQAEKCEAMVNQLTKEINNLKTIIKCMEKQSKPL